MTGLFKNTQHNPVDSHELCGQHVALHGLELIRGMAEVSGAPIYVTGEKAAVVVPLSIFAARDFLKRESRKLPPNHRLYDLLACALNSMTTLELTFLARPLVKARSTYGVIRREEVKSECSSGDFAQKRASDRL